MPSSACTRFIEEHQRRFHTELQEFVRIPSVSSDPDRAGDVKRCAQWLATHLQRLGLRNVRVTPTARHPIVTGGWTDGRTRSTMLLYGHYDVQPSGPIGAWSYPPFAAQIADGFLRGRGASDDKGQLFTHLKSIESLLATAGRLPVNVTCLFEGEEEIGSPNLTTFLQQHQRMFRADAALVSDTRMLGPDRPALTYGLRGQLALELELIGQHRDVHSGNFGGAVHDALQVLCEVIARLHDRQGRIAVPHFYDRVAVPSAAERAYLARTGPSDEALLREAGAKSSWGEAGFSMYERMTIRPSLAVTGIVGGHTGAGPKAVIPCRALAKVSFRLVPHQQPAEIEQLVRQHMRRITPKTMRLAVRTQISSSPALIDRSHPAMRAAALAYTRGFGRAPVWVRSGGSIPVVDEFRRLFNIPTVLMGFASPDDSLHGPDEKFSLRNFRRAIHTSVAFLDQFSAAARRGAHQAA